MSLFRSHKFLDVVVDAYYDGMDYELEEFDVGGWRFRLARLADGTVLTRQDFLEYHEPLSNAGSVAVVGPQWLDRVSHGIVTAEEYDADPRGFDAAPTVIWEGVADWDAYLALLRKRSSLVKDDLRRRRQLEKAAGPVEFTVHEPGTEALHRCLQWKRDQLDERGIEHVFGRPKSTSLFEELQRRELLRVSTLRASGALLSVWLGMVHEDKWYSWVFGHNADPAYRKYSLGRQLLYEILASSLNSGHVEFDFSIGAEPYKWYFATHTRLIGDVGTPPVVVRARRLASRILRTARGVGARLSQTG